VDAVRAVRRLGEAVAGALDLDRLIALAGSAPALPGPVWTPADETGPATERAVVALAGGPGAPYTYVETAELLTAAGADVVLFDPLRDEALPAGARALIIGAGLPEGFAEELSANRRLCGEVAQFARDGWPVIAEGVGLPWLTHELDGRPMCGVLDATAHTGDQTVAGYREATAAVASALAPAGTRITGYKQHRAMVGPRSGPVPAWSWSGGNPEGYVWRQVHASQLGLHWAGVPDIARRVVAAAAAGPQGAVIPAQIGQRPDDDRQWRDVDGQWRDDDGQWRDLENGQWQEADDGGWPDTDNGHRHEVENGRRYDADIGHPHVVENGFRQETGNGVRQETGNGFRQETGNGYGQETGNGYGQETGNGYGQETGNGYGQETGNGHRHDLGNRTTAGLPPPAADGGDGDTADVVAHP
jgi:hypothetical protein